jgi:hypothetical protein
MPQARNRANPFRNPGERKQTDGNSRRREVIEATSVALKSKSAVSDNVCAKIPAFKETNTCAKGTGDRVRQSGSP